MLDVRREGGRVTLRDALWLGVLTILLAFALVWAHDEIAFLVDAARAFA